MREILKTLDCRGKDEIKRLWSMGRHDATRIIWYPFIQRSFFSLQWMPKIDSLHGAFFQTVDVAASPLSSQSL